MSNETPAPTAAQIATNLRFLLDKEAQRRTQEEQSKKERDELMQVKAELQGIVSALQGTKKAPEDPVQSLRSEIAALHQEIQELKSERENETREAKLGNLRDQVVQELAAKDGFELIKATGAESLVFQTIVDNFKTTGSLLSTEDAAKRIEESLSKQVDKVISLESVRKRVAGGTVTTDVSKVVSPAGLTNDIASTKASEVVAPPHVGLPGPAQIEAALKKHGLA